MRRIALWGYTEYSRHVLRSIREGWGNKVEVSMIFDSEVGTTDMENRVATLPNYLDGLTIRHPSEIPGYFEQGRFEGVIPMMRKPVVYAEVEAALTQWGVPIVHMGSMDDVKPPSAFDSVERTDMHEPGDGYRLFELRGIYGLRHESREQESFFLYDGKGSVLRSCWFDDDLLIDQSLLDFPMSPDAVAGDVTDLAGQYCLVSRSWGKNYCHFTFQSLDQIVLMEQAGYEGKYLVLRTDFAEQLLDLMGVDRDRIAWIDDLREGQVCRFERLFVLDPEKYSFRATAHLNLAAARMIESCIGEPTHEYPSRLFVKRVGSRKLLGADALLERYGFVTIVPDDLSVKEQISYFHHADVVVCPHGANSANALYMRPGTVFVETFGKGWVFPWCTEVHLLKGVRDLPVVESPIFPDDHGGQYDDYRVPGELLEMAIRNAIELAQGSQALCLPPKRWSARDGYTHPSQAYWDLGSQTKGC